MKKLVKPAFFLISAQVILMLSGYVIHFFLGRYLGPAQYGIYGVVISLMGSVNLILTSGLPTALSKYIAENPNNASYIMRKTLRLQVIFSLAVTSIYLFSAKYMAQFLNDPNLITYIMLSSLIFPSYSLYSLYFGYYNGLHKFKKQAIIQSVYSISKAILIVLLATIMKLYGAIAGFFIAPLSALFFAPKLAEQKKEDFDHKLLIRFALPVIILSVFSALIVSIDLFMVKALLKNNILTGFYTASSTLARLPAGILSAMNIIIFPSVIKANKIKNAKKLKKTIRDFLIVSVLLIFFAAIIISTTARQLIRVFYSSKYLEASSSLVILAFAWAFYVLFDVSSNILNALGKPKIPMGIVLFTFPLAILFNYLLIPRYSLNGAAIATTISSCLMMICSLSFVGIKYRQSGQG